jgi:hypothetical protein
MSEAASLPGNLFDEPAAQPATRTRQDNWATLTVEGIFTEVHRRHLDRIDLIQPTMDFVKINAGSFTGKQSTINGRTTVSFAKFLHNFKSIVYRIAANCPVQIDAVTHTESIVNELRPGEETPQFITVFNQLVFNILLNASDEEAMNIVLQVRTFRRFAANFEERWTTGTLCPDADLCARVNQCEQPGESKA